MAYFDNAATIFPKPIEVYEFTDKFCRNFGSSFGRSLSKEQQTVSKLVADTRNKLKNFYTVKISLLFSRLLLHSL
ncbi:hypothetical protein HMPREF9466_02220 [Fusobacterium necrophorum subsp. funduliforme 1_1_36S]|nr:hypothetical protein HMPREF9466_02220 [Fusobacterium necrophorum subsp. funduliforme 1_1_36S]